MTIESEIAGLTQATTSLLNAVNVRKTELDQKVALATEQASLAATNGAAQVALAAAQAASAASSSETSAARATAAAGSAAAADGSRAAAAASAVQASGYAGLMLAAATPDSVIRLNPKTVTADLLIPAGFNASSTGPLVIADRVTVTVSNFSTWSIQ